MRDVVPVLEEQLLADEAGFLFYRYPLCFTECFDLCDELPAFLAVECSEHLELQGRSAIRSGIFPHTEVRFVVLG